MLSAMSPASAMSGSALGAPSRRHLAVLQHHHFNLTTKLPAPRSARQHHHCQPFFSRAPRPLSVDKKAPSPPLAPLCHNTPPLLFDEQEEE